MASYYHLHQHISPGAPVCAGLAQPGQTLALSVVNTCGNVHRIALLHGHIAGAPTVHTLFLDNLAGPLTIRTCLHIPHRAKEGLGCKYHLPLAAALGAGLRAGARLGPVAVTGLAGLLHCQLDLLLAAEHGFLKGDPHTGAQIGPLHGTVARAPAAASAKKVTEQITENIAEIRTAEIKPARTARAALEGGMAKLVILASLVRITQNRISLGCFLELRLRFRISRVYIRMILFGQGTIRLFDLRVIRVFPDTQDFIIITFLFCHKYDLRCLLQL